MARNRRKDMGDKHSRYAVCLENVNKQYEDGIPALVDINLKINPGEFVFIVGESGCGKSTLIRLLLRELTATSGKVYVNGYDLNKMKDRTVYENVAFAQRVVQKKESEIRKNVPSMLGIVGLASKYNSKPTHLSGGEQQRTALARALINKPSILLADEPTGNLDPRNSEEIMALLEKINENGTTIVVVTHDVQIVNAMHKRVITLKQGTIVSDEIEGGYNK